ncbi:hypothetical protein F1652_02995 [Pluralibacter gergoviae]|nr:hypothetical protein [Pluralibacter gergoviae]
MAVRISRMDQPVLACSPVISPSRGPGPKPAPMYIAVASAFSTTAASSSRAWKIRAEAWGSTASVASAASPSTMTLLTVPSPGFCRIGIHSSSTSAPVTISTAPTLRAVWLATPM